VVPRLITWWILIPFGSFEFQFGRIVPVPVVVRVARSGPDLQAEYKITGNARNKL
jgi:hypothetical protein